MIRHTQFLQIVLPAIFCFFFSNSFSQASEINFENLSKTIQSYILNEDWKKASEATENLTHAFLFQENSNITEKEINAFLTSYGNDYFEQLSNQEDKCNDCVGNALFYCGRIAMIINSYELAQYYFQKSESIFHQNKNKEKILRAKAALASMYGFRKQAVVFDSLSEEVFQLTQEYFNEEKPAFLRDIYLAKSYVLGWKRKTADALINNEQALILAKDYRDSTETFKIKGLIYFWKRDYETAAQQFEQVIQIGETKEYLKRNADLGESYFYAGRCLTIISQYEKALLFLKKALNFYEDQPQLQSIIYAGIGNAYSSIGNYEEALKFNEKGIDLTVLSAGEEAKRLVTLYKERGIILMESGDVMSSIEWFEKAIQNLKTNKNMHSRNAPEVYNAISIGLIRLQRFEEAASHLHIALQQYKRLKIQPDYAYYHLANLHLKTAQFDSSLHYIQKLLQVRSKSFDSDDYFQNPSLEGENRLVELTVALFKKGDILYQKWETDASNLKDLELAFETVERGREFLAKARSDWSIYEISKRSFFRRDIEMFDDQIKIAHALYQEKRDFQYLNTAFEWAESNKFYTLFTTLNEEILNVPDAVLTEEKELKTKLTQLKNSIIQAKNKNQSASLDSFSIQLEESKMLYETFTKNLQNQFPGYYDLKYKISATSLTELQSQLTKDEVWLEYVVSNSQIQTFIVQKESVQFVKIPIDRNELEKKILDYQDMIQSPLLVRSMERKEFITASHELFSLLIQPFWETIQSAQNLTIVAEDELFYLPFETLISSKTADDFTNLNFLVKDFNISYQYAATSFLKLKSKTAIKDYSLLAFAPVFAQNQSAETFKSTASLSTFRAVEDGQFISLPGTEKEVKAIETILKKEQAARTKVLLRKEATEKSFKENIINQPVQFLHIASHGMPDLKDPNASAIACLPTLSEEDGLLYANEIQNMDIQSDIVILSSCESGIGKLVLGEGMMALNRSFFEAGANNVLFSLWKINDEYSSEWMIKFYENYSKDQESYSDKRYSKAVRAAKLEFLKTEKTANPRFWAPFVLIGS